jgi:peptide-methionine (S)-S-oxide reductase
MSEKATFAAGCFWGVEAEFREVPGVLGTRVGYIGGHHDHPTYQDVCSHTTGHAEALEVDFDPVQVTYEDLTRKFFSLHDPTQLNRQGPDVGDQYRSAVFYHSPEQRTVAEKVRSDEQPRHSRPVVTEVTEAQEFWEAEDYHQRYLEKRGLASCRIPGQEVEPAMPGWIRKALGGH